MPIGASLSMQVVGTWSDGSTRDVTADADWSSGDASIATVSSTPTDKGRVTAVSIGSVMITARIGAITASTSASVRRLQLSALTITPSVATMSSGATQRFSVTALYIVLTIFPIVNVESRTEFAAKIIIVTIAANLLGALIFIAGQRRRRSATG